MLLAMLPCIPLFAGLDRLKGNGPLIAFWAAVGVLAGITAWGLQGVALAGIILAWAVYRQLPFFAGSAAPTSSQRWSPFARHSPPALVAIASAAFGVLSLPAAGLFTLYTLIASCLAIGYGSYSEKRASAGKPGQTWINDILELVRGGLFGACVYAWTILG